MPLGNLIVGDCRLFEVSLSPEKCDASVTQSLPSGGGIRSAEAYVAGTGRANSAGNNRTAEPVGEGEILSRTRRPPQ